MTAQEQQLIDELVERIRNTPLRDKDTAAEQRLQQGLANSPDALYVLAQTVIVQKYGLEQAQQRLQALHAELDSARQQAAQTAHPSGGSFLSHIFGGGSQPAQPQPSQGWQTVNTPGYPQAGSGQPGYAPAPPAYPSGGYAQPSGWGGGGGGGFLQSAMQTAAGVAMGEMAFQGMESLFHGFGGGGYGGGYGRGFEGGGPSETVINNYNDGGEHRHEGTDGSRDRDDSSFYNPSDDASRDSDTRSFADTDSGSSDRNDSGSDGYSSVDSGSGADDSSSFDSGDDGGGYSGGDDSN